jgi:phospholipid/cholesterol/gamma-HCH transport system substrate-binding protein
MAEPQNIKELAQIVESSLRDLNSAMTKTEALSIRIGRRTTQIIRFSLGGLMVLGLIMFYLLYLLTRDMGAMAINTRVLPAMNGSVAGMGQNMANLASISADLRRLMDQQVRPLVENLNRRVEGVAVVQAQATALIQDLRTLTAKLNETADSVHEILSAENRRKVVAVLGNMKTLSDNFLQVSENALDLTPAIDKLVADTGKLLSDNREDLTTAVHELRATMRVIAGSVGTVSQRLDSASRNFNEFSRQVRENPTVLLGIRSPKEPEVR